jgi:hypothetical protein
MNDGIKLYKNNIPSAFTTITISDPNIVSFLIQLDDKIKQEAYQLFKKDKVNVTLDEVINNMKSGIKIFDIGLGNKVVKINAKFLYRIGWNEHSSEFNTTNGFNLPQFHNINNIQDSLSIFKHTLSDLILVSKFWFNEDSMTYGYTIYVENIKKPSI